MDEECSMNGEVKIAYKIGVGKSQRKWELGKPRCRWEDIIKTKLKKSWA
jgi:hypothetical protein